MRQGLFPICIICAVTAASSRKNFDKPSIATEKSFCNSKSVHSRSKQCLRIYKDHFCVAKCLLGNPKPLNCIRRMQATRFCKTLFGCDIGVRSHHGTVMITGIGIASQQANEHSRILILRANLAFVRTKALLATVMVLRMRLRNFSFALQTGWRFCIIGSMNTRIKSERLSD